MTDFFVSYNKDDADWAEWIAWQLEEEGYTTVIQAWDFAPGSDWVNSMDQASKQAARVLPIFSESYIKSEHANSEWRNYQRNDPSANKSLIVPVRVRPCQIEGTLGPRVYINLIGVSDEQQAAQMLIDELRKLPKLAADAAAPNESKIAGSRWKPAAPPIFPGAPVAELGLTPKRIDYSNLEFLRILEGMGDELFSIAFSPDGRWIAAGSNGTVLLWDMTNLGPPESHQSPHESIGDHGSYVYSVAFSHDSRRLVSGCEDGFVRVWDMGDKRFVWKEHRHNEAVYSVAFSPDGARVASGGYDKLVLIWNAERGQVRRSSATDFEESIGRVTSVAFSPDGRMLVVGSLDDSVRLWDLVKGSAHIVGEHDSSVEGVAFSPDGRLLASCGLDKAVRVWDIQSTEKQPLWERKKHEYLVRSVAFSPDSKTLASVGWDKTLILWDVESAVNFWAMPLSDKDHNHWHSDWVWSVAFSPGGLQLASSGSDGQIIVWEVDSA